MIDIKNIGKGALITSPEIAATRFKLTAPPPAVVNWDNPYNVEDGFILPQLDQKQSLSCTAQATVYYGMALMRKLGFSEEYSRRYIYSQVWQPPDGGAYIWKAMSIPLKPGFVSANSVPDSDSSEITMRDSSLNKNATLEALALKYAQIPIIDINQFAQIVIDYDGFVTGFNGKNNMFSIDGTANKFSGISDWGHAVWISGYCRRDHWDQNGLLLHPNEKTLKLKNSWSALWGDNGYGYFPECFVNSGLLYDAYVYADIADIDPTSMNNRFVTVEGQKDVWLVRDGKRSLIYNALAFSLISGDWSKIEKITSDQLNALPDTGKVLVGLDQE